MTTKPVMSMLAAKAALNAATALVTASATLNIYSGAQPATTLTSRSGTLLSDGCTFPSTPFGAASSGTSDGNATSAAGTIGSDTNAAATGTAGYFDIATTAPVVIFQGNVGTSGADLNLNTTSITAGDTVAITSFKITMQCGDGVS
jgi:hypothetical protein